MRIPRALPSSVARALRAHALTENFGLSTKNRASSTDAAPQRTRANARLLTLSEALAFHQNCESSADATPLRTRAEARTLTWQML